MCDGKQIMQFLTEKKLLVFTSYTNNPTKLEQESINDMIITWIYLFFSFTTDFSTTLSIII